jgi:hypothetical protein
MIWARGWGHICCLRFDCDLILVALRILSLFEMAKLQIHVQLEEIFILTSRVFISLNLIYRVSQKELQCFNLV